MYEEKKLKNFHFQSQVSGGGLLLRRPQQAVIVIVTFLNVQIILVHFGVNNTYPWEFFWSRSCPCPTS